MRATQAATFWMTHSGNCVVFLLFNLEADSKKIVQVARLIAGWLKMALVAGGSGGDSVGNSGCD